ncbi:hypothetical protein PGT21_033089 [Puccinia graminis f. sp. tritici]|uniref:Glucose-repressible protein n=1 Tax=Puccinia graminis f. sp. tritici TaxID=56615 RepID=A0A5B0LZ60_PUCGR|nr:hypothetical protein PGT21_033089 [Puccinia graminis f. sp. tritici]
MQTAKDAMNYVSDKASELTNTASKEANKDVAKDSDNSLSSRASAATDAMGDKASEMKDGASAEAHKVCTLDLAPPHDWSRVLILPCCYIQQKAQH